MFLSSSLKIACIFCSVTLCWPIFLSWISEKWVNIYEEYKERRKTLRKLHFLKKIKWKWGFVNLLIIRGNLRDGVWNKDILNRNDKNKRSCSNFYRLQKRLLFIFYYLSCLVFSHFAFPVRLRSASSLEPVNCSASWVYASSKVI